MKFLLGISIGVGLLLGCSNKDADEATSAGVSGTDDSESGSTSGSTTGSTSGSTSTDAASSGSTSSSSTGAGATTTTGDSQGSDSQGSGSGSDTDTPSGACVNDDIELSGVAFEITTNRVLGEGVDAPFDPSQGSSACLFLNGNTVRLTLEYGPFDPYPHSRLVLDVHDGARSYDLAEDPGPPGTGDPGAIELSYGLEEGATTYSFSTINQAATGTLDVIALPVDGGLTIEFDAVGEIAGQGGWVFDMHFTASIPR